MMKPGSLATGDPQPAPLASPVRRYLPYAGWGVVLLGFLLQVVSTGPIFYAFGNYALIFKQEFGASSTLINLAYTLLLMVGALGSAPVGWGLDRLNPKWIALIGTAGTAAGLALMGLTTAIWQVVLLFGTLLATSDVLIGHVTSSYLISQWFERRRGLALGIAILGASVAAISFPPLTTALTDQFGWRNMFFIVALGSLILIIPILLWARLPREIPEFERRSGLLETAEQGERLPLLAMLKTSAFWIISIGIGAMIGITGAVTISLVPHAAAQGFSVMQSSLLVSVVGSGAFIGKVSFGALSDHVELRWAMRGGLVLMLASTAMLLLGGSYPLLLAASALFGLSLGGMMPVWAVLVAHVFGLASCGSALGATRAAMAPFALACPLIAGWAFDLFQSYSYAWAIFCALLLCCLVSTFILRGWSTPLQVASNPPEIVS